VDPRKEERRRRRTTRTRPILVLTDSFEFAPAGIFSKLDFVCDVENLTGIEFHLLLIEIYYFTYRGSSNNFYKFYTRDRFKYLL